MKSSPASSTQPSRIAKSILTGSICAVLAAALAPRAAAVDGTWINNDNTGTAWSDATNWLGGIIGDATDSTVAFVHFPTYNITGTAQDIGSGIVLDGPRTVGNVLFEDLDNYGSSSISVINNGASQTLTLDTMIGVPTILAGPNISAIAAGKKAIFNTVIVAGTDGLRKTGPGFFGLRQASGVANNHTFTGDLRVEGGLLQLASQTVYAGTTLVSGGSTLFMDFANGNAPVTNLINIASPLVLGSNGGGGATRGGGVVVNSVKAATSNAAQTWSGTTLNEGTHQFRLVSGTNQNLTYTLGAVTRNAGATIDFSRSSTAATVVVNATIANGGNGILGGWAVFSNTGNTTFDWAINNGANVMAAFTGYSANTVGSGLHSNLVLPTAVAGVPGGTVTNTIRINNGYSLNIGLAGSLTVETGGILVGQQSPAFTGGTLMTGEANGELLVHTYGGGTGLRIGSVIADNSATPLKLIKAGTGQVTLTQNNTYTGTTYVGAGVLQLGNGWGGGATGALGAGDVFVNGFNNGGGAYATASTLLFNRSGTFAVTNNISGHGNIAQAASGTLVLNKQFNIRNLQGLAGTVRMDFNAATAPASEIINSIETSGTGSLVTSSLLLRSARLDILGKDSTATTQSFGLTVATGAARIAVTPGIAGTVTLNLGALGKFHNNNEGGGTLRLDLPATGVTVRAPNGGSPGQTQQNGLIVDSNTPWVTIGDNDWAAKDATLYNAGTPASSLNIVPGSSIAGFHTLSSGGVFSGNLDIDDSPTILAPSVLSSMRFNAPGAKTVTIDAAATLEPHGILVGTGVGAANVTITGPGAIVGTTATVTGTTTTARDLPLIQNNLLGDLVISAPIVNFDANNRTTLVKSGSGTVALTNGGAGTVTHTYTDRTLVNEGTLKIGAGTSLGTTVTRVGSVLVRSGNLVVESDGRINTGTFTSIGQRIGESGVLTIKDSAVYDISSDFNVGDVSARGIVNVQDNAQLLTKRFFIGKSGFSEGIVNLSGNGQILASNTPDTDWNLGGNGAGDPTAKGTMVQSDMTLLNLLNVNFQIGRNGIGEYNMFGGNVTGTGFHVIGRFVSGRGVLNLAGNGAWDANPSGTGAAYFIVGESGTGTLNVSGGGSLTAKNLSIAHNGGVGIVNMDGGIIDLQNTAAIGTIQAGVVFGQTNAPGTPLPGYGGTLNLNGGTLKTFGIRENPSLTTAVSSVVTFDGGTVQAKGDNATFMQGLDSATIEDGGAIVDSNGFAITISQNLLHDAGGPPLDGGLTKEGAGTLTVNGSTTYTGITTTNVGTLILDTVLPTGNTINANGGTTIIGFNQTLGALNIANGATVVLDDIPHAPAPSGLGESPGFNAQATAVPEPGAISLLALGACAIFRRRRACAARR